jgi:hypothetical protein
VLLSWSKASEGIAGKAGEATGENGTNKLISTRVGKTYCCGVERIKMRDEQSLDPILGRRTPTPRDRFPIRFRSLARPCVMCWQEAVGSSRLYDVRYGAASREYGICRWLTSAGPLKRERLNTTPPPRCRLGVSMGATLTEISKRWRVPVYITLSNVYKSMYIGT